MTEEALIRAHTIASMEDPEPTDLRELQNYLDDSEMRRPFTGVDARVWGTMRERKNRAPDLTTLRQRQIENTFSKVVVTTLIQPLFRCLPHRFQKKDPVFGEYGYKNDTLLQFTRAVVTLFASIILLVSINALYFIKSMMARLGAVSAFNIVFALCLLIFAKAKPIEVFSTTAAYGIPHICL
jgi:hypothetical protein